MPLGGGVELVSLWLGFALLGLLGLLHAAYSRSRYYYLGFGIAVFCSIGIAALLTVAIFT